MNEANYVKTCKSESNLRISRMNVLRPRKLFQRAVCRIVDVGVYQARSIKPHRVLRQLDRGRRVRQAIVESRLRSAGDGVQTEAPRLVFYRVSVGAAGLSYAVCHGLQPRLVGCSALFGRGPGRSHPHASSHLHVGLHPRHAIVLGERSAAQV